MVTELKNICIYECTIRMYHKVNNFWSTGGDEYFFNVNSYFKKVQSVYILLSVTKQVSVHILKFHQLL